MSESANKFLADYAKRGTAGCKKCKAKCEKGALRIAKLAPNPFSESGGDMKNWHHLDCLFETFVKARATTKIIDATDDIDGFAELEDGDKKLIRQKIDEVADKRANAAPAGGKKKGKAAAPKAQTYFGAPKESGAKGKDTKASEVAGAGWSLTTAQPSVLPGPSAGESAKPSAKEAPRYEDACDDPSLKDNSFKEFRKLIQDISARSSYLDKTAVVSKLVRKGVTGEGFRGNLYLLIKLLMPGVVKTVYNLNSKQLVKHFSLIFNQPLEKMMDHLDQGDVADTVWTFYQRSSKITPPSKSTLTLQQVDTLLYELSQYTKDDDQIRCLTTIAKQCTTNDLLTVIRLVKHDLRINSGAKHILDALDKNAYQAFQASRDLRDVVTRVQENLARAARGEKVKELSIKVTLMTPVLPMLAEACKSVEMAFKKCPNGMYAEIKYDGERVQVHKSGANFKYYSRSLKPVLPHKVKHFERYIPEAFPHGRDLILDAEVLMVDTNTGLPLPFGTLGIHKQAEFKDAQVCLFVFDCLLYNNESMVDRPLKERREVLRTNMTIVKNRINFSEQHIMNSKSDLKKLLDDVFSKGLEGLMLKDMQSIYEPGKRHWLKVKKDYLHDGAMADSADLVVLGGYYGTGSKGGIMSSFLMGCYDPASRRWVTVSKVHGGHDDETLARLQKELKMDKISKNASKVPSWLNIKKNLIPDFVIQDPEDSQVWEITGAEFSKSDIHTANGISIRFPRVTKIRDDKDHETATDLPRLKLLYEKAKEHATILDIEDGDEEGGENGRVEGPKKVKGKSNGVTRVSPVKRKREDVDADHPSPKKRKAGTKTPHSQDTTRLEIVEGCGFTNVFVDKKFSLRPGLSNTKEISRQIVANGGEVVSDWKADESNYVICAKAKKSTKERTTRWLVECVESGSIV